jgi:hypothetical protein
MVVITTILAIYGAIVATLSLALTGWTFIASGPKVQAEASLERPVTDNPDGWYISLRVWNTGRQAIKVNFHGLTLRELTPSTSKRKLAVGKTASRRGKTASIQLDWNGPEVPLMLSAHSGENWFGRSPSVENRDILAYFTGHLGKAAPDPTRPIKLSILLQIGGKRVTSVPVTDIPFIYPAKFRPAPP